MNYLKLTNVPLKLTAVDKYGSKKGEIPWEACGFNKISVAMTALQYRDDNDNFIQVLQIADQVVFDTKLPIFTADVEALPLSSTLEVIDEVQYDIDKVTCAEYKAAQKLAAQ